MKNYLLVFISILMFFPSCKKDKDSCNYDNIKVNELQFMGSHNSYRLKTYQPIFDIVNTLSDTGILPDDLDPSEWDYTHLSFPEQLDDYNVRHFEIDVYYDPDGGRFYNRQGNSFVFESTESNIPDLQEPGYKVIHIPDLDYNTHYYTFKQALATIRDWSNQNPSHEPIFVMLELKDQAAGDFAPGLGFATALPYTSQAMEDLEAEVREVYGNELNGVFTPDMLRGDYSTIKEAVTNSNWPTLGEARGHVFYVIDVNSEGKTNYLDGHPTLENRAMFMFSNVENDETAFVKGDNPISGMENIQNNVRNGYFVRTRADAGTTEARTGDVTRREAAFESGAQMISTDYYRADPRNETSDDWTDYSVQFPDGSAFQLNSVNYSGTACTE